MEEGLSRWESQAPSAGRLEQNPAAVYLARLRSKGSRETMRGALETIASLLSSGQADALSLGWETLR
jgi:hypothetical protein